jgi:ABC-type lipoprotein release transport system permease subunit
MGSFAAVVRMVAQRTVGHWRLSAAMVVGAVLCAALMACVVLYSDTVRDLGLKYQLEAQPQFANDIVVTSSGPRLSEYERLRTTSDQIISRQTSGLSTGIIHFGRSATFFPTAPGEAVSADEGRPRANLQFVEGLSEHSRLIPGGKLPAPLTTASADVPPAMEVLIGKPTADAQGIAVGQEFDLYPHWRKVTPVRVKVSGIIEQTDPKDPYWFGRTDRFLFPSANWATLPLFIDEISLRSLAIYLPDMDGTLETYVTIDTGRIHSGNARSVEDRVKALKADLSTQLPLTTAETKLDATIATYREKLFFTRLPLFALMIQIVGIVMFYLVMVSTMVIERQAGEIALLKSRGAGTMQVMMVFLIEGMFMAIVATAVGPLVAVGAIKLLGLTPAFEALSHGELLAVPMNPFAFVLAGAGGLLALLALLWPAYRASGLSITNYKQQISRPGRQPAFLRYYLDLVLVAGAAFAFYQLRQRGSFVTESLFGDLSVDPILLATPSLFMLMVALVFLRLFPLLLQLVMWLTRSLSGATISLGLTRMARSPLQHSRLILLLLLATAVGMFAAGFRSTLERGYEDRAAYKAGAELRLNDIRNPAGLATGPFETAVKTAIGADDAAAAIRLSGYYNVSRFRSQGVSFLGLQPDRFEAQAFWRPDFAGKSLGGLLDALDDGPAAERPAPIAVPDGTRFIGVWALHPLLPNQAPMGLRLRDKDGGIWEYRFGTEGNVASPTSWQFYAIDLTRTTGVRPQNQQPIAAERKWTVEAFFLTLPGAPPAVTQQITLLLDDLQVAPADQPFPPGWAKLGFTQGQVIEPFESIDRYELMKGVSQTGDAGAFSRAPAVLGREGSVVRVQFVRGRLQSPVIAFRAIGEGRPLPVLVSGGFLSEQKKKNGEEFPLYVNGQYITVKVVGSFDLFPTFDPEQEEALFVADYERLRDAATRVPGAGSNVLPNEAWLSSRGTAVLVKAALAERGFQAESIFDRETILAEQASDPLVAASWEGILFLAFAGVLLVSTLGFVTYSALGAQARSLEFAILRTMGLSGRQIFGVITFEQAFVVAGGMAAGTLLGFPLSRLMIGYMGLTESGREPLPPLLSVVNWQSVLTVYALLGIVVVSTVIVLVALYSRLAVSRALRMGEL